MFVLRSSQASSDEEKSFETVTDSDKPYIHCMLGGAIIGTILLSSVGQKLPIILRCKSDQILE